MNKLLDRLEGVRRTGEGRYIARCPSHLDKSPSLSIRETDDGKTLAHCFGGCSVHDVLAAVGLELRDLMPPLPNGHRHAPQRQFYSAREAAVMVEHELTLIGLALARWPDLDFDNVPRVWQAIKRVQAIAREVQS
jgi:hypothetical protein